MKVCLYLLIYLFLLIVRLPGQTIDAKQRNHQNADQLFGILETKHKTQTAFLESFDISNKLYKDGDYDVASDTLLQMLKYNNIGRTEKIQANKLLTMCYLAQDNIELAEETAFKILHLDANYKTDKMNDDIAYTRLFTKFGTVPKVMIWESFVSNIPIISVAKQYNLLSPAGPISSNYKGKPSYQFQLSLEKKIYGRLFAQIGVQYGGLEYEHNVTGGQNQAIYYNEKLTYLGLPVSIKFYLSGIDVGPYLLGGIDFSFLQSAISSTYNANSILGTQKILQDRSALRDNFRCSYIYGCGYTFHVNNLICNLGMNYLNPLGNINKAGTRPIDLANVYNTNYVDDDFKINDLQFNIGLAYVILHKISKHRWVAIN